MRTGSFDDLARTLAEPMPRRRALRFAGAAIVASVLPALRPRGALADGCGPNTPCDSLCKGRGEIGACGTNHTNACGQTDCRLAGCLSAGDKCCQGGDDAWICNETDQCGPAHGPLCVACPDDRLCGKACCKSDEFCGSRNRHLCCKNGDNACLVPGSPQGACCRPGTQCCFNNSGAACCTSEQTCKSGKCVCKQGQTCGEHCCKKGETCSNGKCCPKGKVNCGDGECCKNAASCCGETCCTGDGETCVGGAKGKQCCLSSRISGSGSSARCCPGGTVATATGCCPPTNRHCCDSLDASGLACLGPHEVCVRGACKTL